MTEQTINEILKRFSGYMGKPLDELKYTSSFIRGVLANYDVADLDNLRSALNHAIAETPIYCLWKVQEELPIYSGSTSLLCKYLSAFIGNSMISAGAFYGF